MKHFVSLILAVCMLFSLCLYAFAESGNYDVPADWNVRIAVPDGATAVLQGNEYYLYAQQEGSIPYIMLKTYRADDAAAFLDEFTVFMRSQYPDLKVTSDLHKAGFGERECYEIDYSYQVSGYDVRDRRIALTADGRIYLFTSKEIDELSLTIGNMLDDVVATCKFVTGDGTEQNLGLSDGYLYCDENGVPRYWLDFTRTMEDNLVLHCCFRSGEPASSERCYVLDLSSAEVTENGLRIRQIRSLQDDGSTDRPGNLTLRFYLDAAVMIAEPNGETPAETAENQIPAGSYVMVPVGVAAGPGEKQSHLRPPEDGPYQPEELKTWARFYCFRTKGSFLPVAEVTNHPDGTFTIALSGEADTDGEGRQAIVRYTVDAYGEGKNDLTGEPVSLMR